ncbi:unnamed protein product [Arabidopsis lyrata]|uniref:Uncharacterized protein n=1 Tax=Arabidopsis lyrata subsp. lyrata TaxID=81972 RepID=D7LHI3_ARALL|nr:hypothetical protein ARALYDRAFT_900945 [Arabidopsis lyrata subsp. lyrata]CAH8263336.1 unnamed protein product [Arabidopsis lyrata]
MTALPSSLLLFGTSSPLNLFAILVDDPSSRLSLKSRSASPCSSMDGSSASTPELWKHQTMGESTSADRASSSASFDWVDLVLEAPKSVAGQPKSVLPPPLLVRMRRRTWVNLMVPRFGPSPSPFCPPSSPLPKLSKPMKTSAGLSPCLLRPRSDFNSVLQSPNFLKLLSFRESNERFPVMVMMDLAWISSSLSQNLVDSLSRLVRLLHRLSLVLIRLELISLWKCPRVLLPVPSIINFLSSSLPLAPSNSVLAGNGRHANRVMVCLGWLDSYLCRDQMLSLLWTLSKTLLPNHRQLAFRVKKTGIMTLSLRSRCYRSFFNSLPTHSPIIEFSHVLIYCLDNLQSSGRLEKYGIMTMSSRGGYRLFFNLVNPSASSAEHFSKSSDALFIHQLPKRVKKNGIMIPSLRSGGYRSFFNSLSPPPLKTKLIHVQIKEFRYNTQTFNSLKKNGIMTPSPRRGGYQSFSNLFYPTASSVEHFLKSSFALFARAVYDHPLVEDFVKPVFMVESAMASKDSSNFANFFKMSIILENSWSLYLYSYCIFLATPCMNFPLLRF